MPINRGKQFEQRFRDDMMRLEDVFLYRLPDQMSGYKSASTNPCDFFCFMNSCFYMIEVKSVKGNTFPITNFTQYYKMKSYAGIDNMYQGVVIWFIDHDKIIYVPLKTFDKLFEDNKKSVNIRTLEKDGYEFVSIPSTKKRVFLVSDYTCLKSLPKGW